MAEQKYPRCRIFLQILSSKPNSQPEGEGKTIFIKFKDLEQGGKLVQGLWSYFEIGGGWGGESGAQG